MPALTLSEALAHIQTIDQQIARKQRIIEALLFRAAALRDPLAAQGGTSAVLVRELRSIQALHERKIHIRRAVQAANQNTTVTHAQETRSIADWLVWKREVAGSRAQFLSQLSASIDQARRQLARQGRASMPRDSQPGTDLVVHLNEQELADEIETLEETQGYLAGQLAVKNAVLTVELPGDETWQTGLEERFKELPGTLGSFPVGSEASVWLNGLTDPAKKIQVIKVVRELTGCGLAEAKNLVEQAPRAMRENISRQEAEQMRAKLEAAGASVTLRT